MDGPSKQLEDNLNSSIQRALTSHRPILTHLNADTSWLIQLPYPLEATPPSGRSRWNIILDPWWVQAYRRKRRWAADASRFQGPQSDVARLFSTQWHSVKSCVQSMAELSQELQDIETRALCRRPHLRTRKPPEDPKKSKTPYIDAVIISHEFTDHCNKRTLLELDTGTPVFATKRAVDLIRSWNHFDVVQDIPSFSVQNSDWRKASLHPLPSWLGICQMVSCGDALDYHSAILLAFDMSQASPPRSQESHTTAEGIIYSPHGIHAQDLRHLPTAFPPIKTLVLLHGLHDIKISIQKLNLGAHNGLQAQRVCQAKYWVSTHDEIKRSSGFITPWLHRNALTLQEALDEERKARGEIGNESRLVDMRGVTFADLSSGESLLLM